MALIGPIIDPGLCQNLQAILQLCREFQTVCPPPEDAVAADPNCPEAQASPCTQLPCLRLCPCLGNMFRAAGRQFRRGMNDVDDATHTPKGESAR